MNLHSALLTLLALAHAVAGAAFAVHGNLLAGAMQLAGAIAIIGLSLIRT